MHVLLCTQLHSYTLKHMPRSKTPIPSKIFNIYETQITINNSPFWVLSSPLWACRMQTEESLQFAWILRRSLTEYFPLLLEIQSTPNMCVHQWIHVCHWGIGSRYSIMDWVYVKWMQQVCAFLCTLVCKPIRACENLGTLQLGVLHNRACMPTWS